MVRVAHLLPNMAVGGRERVVADLCRTAASHGIRPTIVTYDPLPPGTATIDAGDTPVIALDRRAGDFAARLAGLDIDLLHGQGHIAAAITPRMPVPVVATVHVALGEGWRWLPAIGRGLRRAAAVTAVSDDLARRFAFVAGRRPGVITTGVDLRHFVPDFAAPRRATFTIGIAARLHPVKRHVDLIAAVRRLHDEGRRVRLLIAGEGPLASEIAAAAAGLDVAMLGAVDDPALFYRGLDAFVLASDHEGTPAALLEAMASGCACVVTAAGGMPAALGDAGLVVPRRDPAALADALSALSDDPAGRERLRHRAAARARRHALTASAGDYARLYRAVLARRAQPRHFAS